MSFRWISLLVVVLMATIAWVVVGLTQRDEPEYLSETYKNHLIPIAPELDEKALDEILKREGDTMLIDRNALE